MKKLIFALLATSVLSLICNAQKKPVFMGDVPKPATRLSLADTATSPIRDLPKATDRVFVRDEQPGVLDTSCTYRADGPLRISVPVNRVITKVDPDLDPVEYLNVINKQKNFLYLSEKVKIQMPVYDIDPTEQDDVYFNGHLIGKLYGSNETWTMNYFEVPVELIKFGKHSNIDTPALASDNEITIDIDVAGIGWCMAVDWTSLSFEAMSPIILIHGNSSDGEFFDRQGLTEVLGNHKLLYDNKLNLLPNSNYIEDSSVDESGNVIKPNNLQINEYLKKAAKAFGVDSMHLVMHSKGGLDTRSYLSVYQPSNNQLFKILSYSSIATPHNGSILADIVIQRAQAAKNASRIEYDDNFPTFARQVFSIATPSTGHKNLTTDYVRSFNQRNISSISGMDIQFNATGSDADLNRNGTIGLAPSCFANESAQLAREGNGIPFDNFPTLGVGTVMYQTIRDIQAVRVETRIEVHTLNGEEVRYTIPKFISTPTATPQVNDTLVSKDSSQGKGFFEQLITQSNGQVAFYDGCTGANHATIPGRSAADLVFWIWSNDISKGDWERR